MTSTYKNYGPSYTYRTYYRDNLDRIQAWQKNNNTGANPKENGLGERYEYDDKGQLTRAYYDAPNPSVDGSGYQRDDNFTSYDANWNWRGYDALGNRRGNSFQWNLGGFTWYNRRDNGLNQYTQFGPWATAYDDQYYEAPGNGVVMQEGFITASYNALNQPIAIYSPDLPANQFMWFGYDPLGRCVKRWIGPVNASDPGTNPATYLYYDGWNLAQEGGSVTGASRYYLHGGRTDEIVATFNAATSQWGYHHYDLRGHCIMITDGGGNLMEQYEYDAFGKPYFSDAAGNNLGYSPFGNRFLFTGREYLPELRLYDFRNRLYQPQLGRFLQPDPIGFAGGDANLYRYAGNDPINRSDPTGLVEKIHTPPRPCGNSDCNKVGGYDWNNIPTGTFIPLPIGADLTSAINFPARFASTDGRGSRSGDAMLAGFNPDGSGILRAQPVGRDNDGSSSPHSTSVHPGVPAGQVVLGVSYADVPTPSNPSGQGVITSASYSLYDGPGGTAGFQYVVLANGDTGFYLVIGGGGGFYAGGGLQGGIISDAYDISAMNGWFASGGGGLGPGGGTYSYSPETGTSVISGGLNPNSPMTSFTTGAFAGAEYSIPLRITRGPR